MKGTLELFSQLIVISFLSERTGSFPLEMRQTRLASGFRLTENRRISVGMNKWE